MANPETKQQKRGKKVAAESRRKPASAYIYQFSERAQGGTNPEVYRILDSPNPEEENSPARED